MLRINQLAKELGVANQEVIEACEKRLSLQGKSHSSNLTDDQADQVRRALQGKHKGGSEAPPLALHRASTAVKVVKAPTLPPAAKAELPPEPPKLAPAVLVKKAEPRPEAEPPAEPRAEAQAAPASTTPAGEGSAPAPAKAAAPAEVQETFSRLKVSTGAPVAAPKDEKPARYIQLPPARPTGPAAQRPAPSGPGAPSGPRLEAGARPIVQRPGQAPGSVQRSGMPQKEKAVLPMATNTGRGEVRHEPPAPIIPARRPYIPPAITEMRSEQG